MHESAQQAICNFLPPRVFVFTHEMPLYALEKRLHFWLQTTPSRPSKAGTSTLERRERQARQEPGTVPSNSLCIVNNLT